MPHRALELLARAGIEEDAIPATFDRAAFLEAVDRLSRRHLIRSAGEAPPATAKQRRQANAVVHSARKAAAALRQVLAETGSPVPGALLDGMEQAAPFLGELPNGRPRLELLLSEMNKLARTERRVEALLGSFNQGGKGKSPSWSVESGITSWVELLGHDLPNLYQSTFGHPCNPNFTAPPTTRETDDKPRPSRGLRFIVEIAAECGVTVKHDAALVACKQWRRWKRQQKKTEGAGQK